MEAYLNKMARKSMRLNYFFRFGDAFAQNPNGLKDIGIALASRGHLGCPQKNKCRGSAISYIFGISFADPFLGGCFRLRSKPRRLSGLRDCWDYFMIPFGGMLQTSLKTQAASPQAFLLPKLAEASFARSDNKKPTKIRGF